MKQQYRKIRSKTPITACSHDCAICVGYLVDRHLLSAIEQEREWELREYE